MALSLAACSNSGAPKAIETGQSGAPTTSGGTTGAAASSSGSASLRALLPASIKRKGTLIAGLELDYPPDQFYEADEKTPTGYNVDIVNALAALLGLRATFVNQNFNGIIAGMNAGRYDIGPSGFYDTPQREQQANFVDFMNIGNTITVPKANPKHIESIYDFCGLTIAQGNGEAMVGTEQSLSKSYCLPKGKSAINVQQYPNETAVYQAILTGRADATLETFDTVAYQVKQHPTQFAVVGPLYTPILYGIALPKNGIQLAKALAAALNELIANGDYAKIMKKWNIEKASIPYAYINRQPYHGTGG